MPILLRPATCTVAIASWRSQSRFARRNWPSQRGRLSGRGCDMADTNAWLRAARDLGRAIAPGEALTVLIGAGASISSGAPSYPAVNETVATKIATRLDPKHLANEIHKVDKRDLAAG